MRYSGGVKKILAILVLIGAAGTAFFTIDKVRMATIAAIGRSDGCSIDAAMHIKDHSKQQAAAKNQILAASRRLQLEEDYEQWQTPGRAYWIPRGSQFVLPVSLAEQAEDHAYAKGDKGVKAGDIVLDCGANVGVTVQPALEAGAKTVVAIEPAPENLECLRRNFPKEIAEGRVILYPKGVSNREEVQTSEGGEGKVEIPLTTVDKIVAELKLDRVDYIKMDVDGSEPNALRGAHDTLAKYKPRLSISSDHLPGQGSLIPRIVRETRADYKVECGSCNEVKGEMRIRPGILYFQ
jgi:FkbM family methyltransferase